MWKLGHTSQSCPHRPQQDVDLKHMKVNSTLPLLDNWHTVIFSQRKNTKKQPPVEGKRPQPQSIKVENILMRPQVSSSKLDPYALLPLAGRKQNSVKKRFTMEIHLGRISWASPLGLTQVLLRTPFLILTQPLRYLSTLQMGLS